MPKKPKLPTHVRTLAAIAALIRDHFKMSCDKMKIKNWQTRITPPFPYARENNEFDVQECFAWVKRFKARKGEVSQTDLNLESLDIRAAEAHANKKITAAERDRFELDKIKGEYVQRDVVETTIRTAMKSYHAFVKQEIEINNPMSRKTILQELGASPEIIAQFLERDLKASIATIDRIEKRCEGGF